MKSDAKKIMLINFLVYLAFHSVLLAIYLLPFRLNAMLGAFLGTTYYRIDRTRHRSINANISVVFRRKLDNKQNVFRIIERDALSFLGVR